jgi:hypothetical protein
MKSFTRLGLLASGSLLFTAVACSAGSDKSGNPGFGPDASVTPDGGLQPDPDSSIGFDDVSIGDTGIDDEPTVTINPTTCEDAAKNKTYVGCDFWPTVTANIVWSVFDFAVVVANAQSEPVEVTITGNGIEPRTLTVEADGLAKVFLPWNAELKGADTNECGESKPLPGSVLAKGGAYHLVSSKPVTVYQFNALEYKPAGGPEGKDWSQCPGTAQICQNPGPLAPPAAIGCFSYSNDASLLLPSTAMTGNYRVTGIHGWSASALLGPAREVSNGYIAITGTQDGTTVKVRNRARILAGGGITATNAGGELTLTLNAGDVAELVSEARTNSDLSGSLVAADKPVQVIAGIPCLNNPIANSACDHIEETVLPAETFGKDYFVTVPTAPNGRAVGHTVRIFGNRNDTRLTYAPAKPAGAPDVIVAGQTVAFEATADFRVTSDREFAVASVQWGASRLGLGTNVGDPSLSQMTAIAQYRSKYIFLAPSDYDTSFADVIFKEGSKITVDGTAVPAGTAIGATGYRVARVKLGPGKNGAHVAQGDGAFGLQVMGYGANTSYQYPGGLDLRAIAPPPPIQ